VFDFAGPMVESIQQFYREFGAKQVPYNRRAITQASVTKCAMKGADAMTRGATGHRSFSMDMLLAGAFQCLRSTLPLFSLPSHRCCLEPGYIETYPLRDSDHHSTIPH